VKEFHKATGVGINLSEKDHVKLIEDAFKEHNEEIMEKKYNFQFNKILNFVREKNKWVDMKIINDKLREKQVAFLGEKPKVEKGQREKKNKPEKKEEKKDDKAAAPEEEKGTKNILELVGRDCAIGANSEEHLAALKKFTGGFV